MIKSLETIGKKKAITFKVEDIPLAEKLLEEVASSTLLQKYSTNIEASSNLPKLLVDKGFHPFLGGMYQAYSEHRPFVVSPEMLWIVICQGFSSHLQFNQSSLTKFFPELLERKELVVKNNKIILGNPTSPWAETVAPFIDQMKEYLGDAFVEGLRTDFSQTTATEKIVGDLTIMDTMKPYFEYILHICICGIPEITLEGEQSDWENILQKLALIRKFDLAWWIDELVPIIEQIKNTYTDQLDRSFWRNMFKIHTKESYGRPQVIDGWIMKFFPYDRTGERILQQDFQGVFLEQLFDRLPSELKVVDFKCLLENDNGTVVAEKKMEYWTGFIGLSQNKDTYAIRPEMGWFVAHASETVERHAYRFKDDSGSREQSREYFGLKEFPFDLIEKEEFCELILNFLDTVQLPENITKVKAQMLRINGKISKAAIQDLTRRFDSLKTRLIINKNRVKKSTDKY